LVLHGLGGRGSSLLFVHATGFHGRVWSPVAAELADRYACSAIDLRGHGESPMPSSPPVDWNGFGRDVLAVADHFPPGLIGVGHSLGAAALMMAELARPGTFRALVLYEPALPEPGTLDGEVPLAYAARTRRRRATFASREEAAANFASKPPTNEMAPDVLWAYVDHGLVDEPATGRVRLACEPDVEAAIYEGAGSSRLWTELRPLACPVTLVAGALSDPLHGRSTNHVAEGLGVPVLTLAGAAHFGPMQEPRRFAALIRTALDAA
jgi:pimeloyl-ACP methyl ester carboxylesterase